MQTTCGAQRGPRAGAVWVWFPPPCSGAWSRAPWGKLQWGLCLGETEGRGVAQEQKGVLGTVLWAGQWHTQGWGAEEGQEEKSALTT